MATGGRPSAAVGGRQLFGGPKIIAVILEPLIIDKIFVKAQRLPLAPLNMSEARPLSDAQRSSLSNNRADAEN